jgi:hypothetical protein
MIMPFPILLSERRTPFGVYDQNISTRWVSIGADLDAAEFAVENIRRRFLPARSPKRADGHC